MRLTIVFAALLAAAPLAAQPVDTLIAVRLTHPPLDDPRSIAVDPFGNIFIVDAGRDVILKLAPSGHHEATLGGPGSREGEFDSPVDVDPTNGMVIFVADAGNRRIQRFSRALAFLGSIPLKAQDERRSADPARATYRRRDSEADDFSSGTPAAVASTSANELFAIDADRNVVLKLSEDRTVVRVIGGHDAAEGRLVMPAGLTTGGDLLYVIDEDAVVVYDLFGTYVRTVRAPRIRAAAAREGTLHLVSDNELRTYGPAGLERIAVLDTKEAIRDLAIAPDGSLLALTGGGVFEIVSSK